MKSRLKRFLLGGGAAPSRAVPPPPDIRYVPAGRRFEGKVAVVTGASGGIGRATALAFAREGASVALIARREVESAQTLEQVKALGAEGIVVRADVTDPAQVRAAFARISERFGRLDVAFNNAGIHQKNSAIAEIDEGDFDRLMATNVKGMWLCMREEIALMHEHGGALVNMSSIRAYIPNASFGAYAASKAAVVSMSKTAALDHADRNIRVNAICPGFVRTEMTRSVDEHWLRKRVPTQRWIEPEEIAEIVLFLCSDTAASIVGEAIIIDGGLSLRSW